MKNNDKGDRWLGRYKSSHVDFHYYYRETKPLTMRMTKKYNYIEDIKFRSLEKATKNFVSI